MSLPRSFRKTQQRYLNLTSRCGCGEESFPLRSICSNCKGGSLEIISNYMKDAELVVGSHYFTKTGDLIAPGYIKVNEGTNVILATRIADAEPDEINIEMKLEPTFRRLRETDAGTIEYGTIHRPKKLYKKFEKHTPKDKSERAGITGYGVCIPLYRIKMEEIARALGKDASDLKGIGFDEKSVPAFDQDSATMAVDATRNALIYSGVEGKNIDGLWVGSESHPYAVKPTAATVAEAIEATPFVRGTDTEFACSAAANMIPDALNSIEGAATPKWKNAMVIGTDNSQAEEGDALDFTVGAGAGALMFGKGDVVALPLGCLSITTDIPDFWRREGEPYPQHGGGFTGKPAYFKHVIAAGKNLMKETGIGADDIDYAVLHQPTGKFPFRAAEELGIDRKKLEHGFIAKWTGNTYSASTLIGLANILDHAKPEENILQIAYGSGATAIAMLWETTEAINQNSGIKVEDILKEKKYVDYHTYRRSKSGH